jgi:glycosyltransferase involved in cell wall biosynthesis
MHLRFFSIILPAYNEEHYIEKTLVSLKNQSYPKDRYEIIVVENGSSDQTFDVASRFSGDSIHVYHSDEKGVSKARNYGITRIHQKTEWCITMDADTSLRSSFLEEINTYLETHKEATHGMAYLSPDEQTLAARFWFWYRSTTDRLLQTLDTIHIVRRDIAEKHRYDENLQMTEDLEYAKSLRHYGGYFFLNTSSVITSVRRFKQKGYLNMFFLNLGIGILYVFDRKYFTGKRWDPIR